MARACLTWNPQLGLNSWIMLESCAISGCQLLGDLIRINIGWFRWCCWKWLPLTYIPPFYNWLRKPQHITFVYDLWHFGSCDLTRKLNAHKSSGVQSECAIMCQTYLPPKYDIYCGISMHWLLQSNNICIVINCLESRFRIISRCGFFLPFLDSRLPITHFQGVEIEFH